MPSIDVPLIRPIARIVLPMAPSCALSGFADLVLSLSKDGPLTQPSRLDMLTARVA